MNGHAKVTTGMTTGTQSCKKFNPSMGSLKNSPKASLGETKNPNGKETKLKKVEIG